MEKQAAVTNGMRRRLQKGRERLVTQLKVWSSECDVSSVPSRILALGNAGFACGNSGAEVEQGLKEVCGTGHLDDVSSVTAVDVLMVPDKPFALASFDSVESAAACYETIVEYVFLSSNGQKLPWFPVYVAEMNHRCGESHIPQRLPPGLVLLPDFVSEDEETSILSYIDRELREGSVTRDNLKNRTALHYGFQFRYGTNDIDTANPAPHPIPSAWHPLMERLVESKCMDSMPDQLTVNVYEPGQGIPPHIDTHSAFEDGIASLSLGSAVVMDFSFGSVMSPVILQPRSVISMRESSRYAWTHGIAPRTTDYVANRALPWRRGRRVSLTFRRIRRVPCQCKFPQFCDNPLNASIPNEAEGKDGSQLQIPENVEDLHVYQVYEDIAPHFSDTRYKPWPRVTLFLNSLKSGSILYDVGCGNGKYLNLRKDLFEVGCDRSFNLIDICRDRKLEVLVSDVLTLPFREACCDAVICIAVIHHLSTQERRIEALQQLVRILRIGGRGLVYVWALEQKKDQNVSTYLKAGKPSTTCQDRCDERGQTDNDLCDYRGTCSASGDALGMPVHANRTEFKQQDILVPWHLKGKQKKEVDDGKDEEKVFHRYYHVFREGELKSCIEELQNVEVVEEYYDEGNWCIVFRKIS